MIVITNSGKEVDKKNARKIKDLNGEFKYYEIGNINQKNSGDCYQINGIYYTLEKGRIAWDNYLNQYSLKSKLIEGFIDENHTTGYFSKECPTIVSVFLSIDPISDYCISRNVALSMGLIEGEANLFYNPEYYTYDMIIPRSPVDRSYKNSLPYNFKNILDDTVRHFENYTGSNSPIANELYHNYKYLFDQYTFGIEIETVTGVIPSELCENLGVRPVRDGSISGLEYVTIPLSKSKGVHAFIDIINLINKYTSSDFSCSMHIHVGGIPRDISFISAMFKTMYHIQNDLYDLFPLYKKNNNGNIKRQCYTSPLDSHLMASLNYNCKSVEDLQNDFQKIAFNLSGRNEDFKRYIPLDNIYNHPSDPSESSKWYMKERYKLLNLIPLIFTNKKTIEYRIFTVPNTIEKAISFLLISLLITDFVNRNHSIINRDQSVIKNYSLSSLLSQMMKSSSKEYKHILDRTKQVSSFINYKGGFFEEKDIKINKYATNSKVMVSSNNSIWREQLDDITLTSILQGRTSR